VILEFIDKVHEMDGWYLIKTQKVPHIASALQEESAMMVCNLEHHAIGQLAYRMT
jgi:hypothetical protein